MSYCWSKSKVSWITKQFTCWCFFVLVYDGRFSTAVAEMLVQSTVKDLYLLPALPRDKWPNGCAKGLKARGGVTVSVCWREGDLVEVGLWSNDRNTVKRLHYRGTTATTNILSDIVYTFNKELKCIKTDALQWWPFFPFLAEKIWSNGSYYKD